MARHPPEKKPGLHRTNHTPAPLGIPTSGSAIRPGHERPMQAIQQAPPRRGLQLHGQRGISTVRCLTGDGLTERRAGAVFDRIAVWCTPSRLPSTLVDQLAPDGRMVVCLPIAPLPSLTLITTITLGSVPAPKGQDRRVRRVRAEHPDPRRRPHHDSPSLDRLVHPRSGAVLYRGRLARPGRPRSNRRPHDPGHQERYEHLPLDWRSLTTHLATLGDPQLSVAARRGQDRGIGPARPRRPPRSSPTAR